MLDPDEPVVVVFRLPRKLKDRIRDLSQKQRIPMSAMLREWIEDCIPHEDDVTAVTDRD